MWSYKQKKAYGFFLIGIVRDDLAATYNYDVIDQSLTWNMQFFVKKVFNPINFNEPLNNSLQCSSAKLFVEEKKRCRLGRML
jgi:hypothetical protein